MKHLSLILLAIIIGCDSGPKYEKTSNWIVHNPTKQSINIKIDGKAIQLAAGKSEELKLDAGKHSFDALATGPLDFVVYVNSKGGLINPTLSTYISESLNYTVENKPVNPDFWGPMKTIITVDGVSFEGMFKVHNDLLIDKNWSYAPDEEIPNEITTYDNETNNEIKVKMYTKVEFFKEMKAKPLAADPLPKWQFPELSQHPKFDSPEMEKASQSYRIAIDKYCLSTNPKEHEDFQKNYVHLIQPLTDAYVKIASKITDNDIKTYQLLMSAEYFKGARVLPKITK